MVPEGERPINELIETAVRLRDLFGTQGWDYCFIGGIAVQARSEPRYTGDVDLTLLTGFGGEETFVRELLAHFRSRTPNPEEFAVVRRVLLLEDQNGIGIDIAMGALDFEYAAVARATETEVAPGVFLRICLEEDLIVMKAFASRPIDWQDVRMTIVRKGEANLDWDYILKHLTPLVELKEEPEILTRLAELREKYRGFDQAKPRSQPSPPSS